LRPSPYQRIEAPSDSKRLASRPPRSGALGKPRLSIEMLTAGDLCHMCYLRFHGRTIAGSPAEMMMIPHSQSRAPLLLLFLPISLFVSGLILNSVRGPYWLGANSDPEYAYLLNALNLAQLHPVGHSDHPGTPVQILGAIILRAVYPLLSQEEDLARAVLRDPEAYLNGMNATFLAINTGMLLALGIGSYRVTRSLGLALLLQLSPFLSATILMHGLTRVSPEPLLLCAVLLLLMVLVRIAFSHVPGQTTHAVYAALVAGFGIAAKLDFLPLVLIPLIALRSWLDRGLFIVGTSASFLVFTAPIMDRYGSLAAFAYRLLTRAGNYGTGSVGFTDRDTLWANAQTLASVDPAFLVILGVASGLIIVRLITKRPGNGADSDTVLRMLVAVVSAQAIGFLVAAKYGKPHYLLPELCLISFTIMLFRQAADLLPSRAVRWCRAPAGAILVGALIMAAGVSTAVRLVDVQQARNSYIQNYRTLRAMIEAAYSNHIRVTYYGASSPLFALFFGDQWSGLRYGGLLREIYGPAYFYNVWVGESYFAVLGWKDEFSMEAFVEQYGDRMLFHGAPIEHAFLTGEETGSVVQLIDLAQGDQETLYAVGTLTRSRWRRAR
jgi:hypothetical protein